MTKRWLLMRVLLAICAAAASAADGATEPSGLKRLMGDEAFEAAGLESLNAKQLAALERWLEERGVLPPVATESEQTQTVEPADAATKPERPATSGRQAAPSPAAPAAAVTAEPAGEDDEVRAVIVGVFEGWSGTTYFSLNNGQIWQQRTAGRYSYRGEDVEVRIYKNRLGFHMLEVVATGRSIGVRRVR
jgi:hypothetical protein